MSVTKSSLPTLRGDYIYETVARLHDRIKDRFPDSGLATLCGQLVDASENAANRSLQIAEPIAWVRRASYGVSITLILLLLASIAYAIEKLETKDPGLLDVVSAVEAGVNELIFLALAIFFFVNLEKRIKRNRCLAAIHELRSMAHIIDMHQLTKDPERLTRRWIAAEHSPRDTLSAAQLSRYLEYCGEMLSLTGKIAALYVGTFSDDKSVAAVGEVEALTTGLSRKIWQKIMLLRQLGTSGDLRDSETPTNIL